MNKNYNFASIDELREYAIKHDWFMVIYDNAFIKYVTANGNIVTFKTEDDDYVLDVS